MKIAVWKTGHEIADTVAESVYEGLRRSGIDANIRTTNAINDIEAYDCHVAYGILRGTSEVFKQAEAKGKFWFNIDKGYFNPGHYDGYYRISLRGTQQTTGLDKLKPDYDRWEAMGIEIYPKAIGLGEYALACPATDHVKQFFNCGALDTSKENNVLYRRKDSGRTLEDDLAFAEKVITFNSSIGWEALRQGIPVISDPYNSIVGAYQKLIDSPLHLNSNARRDLFGIMASLQLTLSEMREGKLWPLLNRLISL